MAGTYRAVVVTGRGGLDRLEVQELPVPQPGPNQVLVRVRASGAGATDLIMRTAYYPYAPSFPFTPGYEVVGEVEALGPGVTGLIPGQRVCGLVVHGGQAEYLLREAHHFVPVPEGLDDAEVVALILNYVTAYQMIHRVAKMTASQIALVTGANGGCGSATLELLRDLGARAIGAAAPAHFDMVRDLGGVPIESRSQPLATQVLAMSDGVDVTFDGLGGKATRDCIDATRKGGLVVGYGFVAAQKHGRTKTGAALRGIATLYLGARLAGRRGTFFGITKVYRKDVKPFHEDLGKLFALLRTRKIRPKIAARLPLLDGRKAQELLVSGGIAGKIVLLRDVR